MIKVKEKMYWQKLSYLDFSRCGLPDFVKADPDATEYGNFNFICSSKKQEEFFDNLL